MFHIEKTLGINFQWDDGPGVDLSDTDKKVLRHLHPSPRHAMEVKNHEAEMSEQEI